MREADHEQSTFRFAEKQRNEYSRKSLTSAAGDLPKMELNHSFISDAGSFASLTQ